MKDLQINSILIKPADLLSMPTCYITCETHLEDSRYFPFRTSESDGGGTAPALVELLVW